MASMELVQQGPSRRDVIVLGAGLVTGFLTPLAQSLVDQLDLLRNLGGVSMTLGGIPFAVLVVMLARGVVRAEWWRALLWGLATVIGFEVAIMAAAEISMASRGTEGALLNVVAGLAGGLIGSAVMAAAALSLSIGPRQPERWLAVVGVGTIVGVLLAVDIHRRSDNLWVLFPVWQSLVALMLARALGASRTG